MPNLSEKSTSMIPSFEENIERLEAIVNTMEEGNLNLEVWAEDYARAMQLLKQCQQQLSAVELKIDMLDAKDGDFS